MITHEELHRLLFYDPDTGDFGWLIKRKKVNPGEIAGSVNTRGYRNIQINNKWYGAHRLAWLYMTGSFPPSLMDHINGIKDDNRFCNLREATPSENCCHRRSTKGAYYKGNGWEASIMKHGRSHYLGRFKSADDAYRAYLQAARQLHGDFAHGV